MAETLLAILLVTSSAKGPSLVYRWPPFPQSSPRLARPRPVYTSGPSRLDNAWRASNSTDMPLEGGVENDSDTLDNEEYEWKRPNSFRDRSISFSNTASSPTSRPTTPFKDDPYLPEDLARKDDYDDLFGYSPEFLANLLCPQEGLCHQKFELLVDDLAFIGHPVSAEPDGMWQFKPEKIKSSVRGREYRNRQPSRNEEASTSPDVTPIKERQILSQSSWLHTFHFVLVLDLPDPSSSASGNVSKYFDIIYEQIAFTVTAVLFQEQVLSNFVEVECDTLSSLKDEYISKGEPFSRFTEEALKLSSIASSMKTLFEAIKMSSMAYMTIHDLPLELQLPPYLDFLLHSEEEDEIDFVHWPDDDWDAKAWGTKMSFGWRLPTLTPWKGLLLLDGHSGMDLSLHLRGPQVSTGDTSLVEGLIKFLETASVTIPLADMASLLDWDLESQVFPTVRWLVHHRRAKVVDTVHPKLKTVFTLPPKFDFPLAKLTADFEHDFSHSSVPSLPQILSTISTSASKQSDFFTSVVRSKDLIPLYHDVVLWMLKRDLLITFHLRIRVVATQELKMRVRMIRERARAKRMKAAHRVRRRRTDVGTGDSPEISSSSTPWASFSPESARRYSRQLQSTHSGDSELSDLVLKESEESDDQSDDDEDDEDNEDSEDEDEDDEEGEGQEWEEGQDEYMCWDNRENYLLPTMINDPGRATPLQRRWLSAMSEGKDASVARRFEQINQYFDGKRSDDEILFRAEITRKQLREVLHHYEEYLQTFLHPS